METAVLAAETLSFDNGDLWLSGDGGERMRVVLERRAHAGWRRPKMDTAAQDIFLYGLSQSLTVEEAATLAGVRPQAPYELRKKDPEFARRWSDAYEAGISPLERRAQSIGLTGDPASMATVRALELAMKLRLGSLRHPGATMPRASAELKDGDGRSFKVVIGSPGVD